jgi:hypothetical protein
MGSESEEFWRRISRFNRLGHQSSLWLPEPATAAGVASEEWKGHCSMLPVCGCALAVCAMAMEIRMKNFFIVEMS